MEGSSADLPDVSGSRPSTRLALECRGVSVAYGSTVALRSVDLAVRRAETLALLGPSGSGKTTLLYAVAGFLPLAAGEIHLAGSLASGPRTMTPPERRDLAMVFQHYALWPHMTAIETAAYPLRRAGMRAGAARQRARELLDLMSVGRLEDRRPDALSGGEQQRVGVARALAREASLILLDEPTAHLDAPLRASLMTEIAEQRARTGAAAVYATHDVTEALAVAHRVALLRDGAIVQLGTPIEIYERPVDLWAARLSGPASVLHAELLTLGGGRGRVRVGGADIVAEVGGEGRIGPSQLLVRADWASLGGDLAGRVRSVWFRGPHTDYFIETAAGELELRDPGPPRAARGEAVGWRLDRAWLLPAAGQEEGG